MNAWQLLRQVRHLLRAATWPDGTTEKVWGDTVFVSVAELDALAAEAGELFALVRLGRAERDRHSDRVWRQTFAIDVGVLAPGQAEGEDVLLGAHRVGGLGSSQGRGLLELEHELYDAVRLLHRVNGVRVLSLPRSAADVARLDDQWGATRGYAFEAVVQDARSYEAPWALQATDAGGGSASLTWRLPPDRYDRLEVVLRRASGATAPASVTAGTGVTLASGLATAVTDAAGVGTWSYALFGGYDEDEDGSSDRYSAAATVTVTLA